MNADTTTVTADAILDVNGDFAAGTLANGGKILFAGDTFTFTAANAGNVAYDGAAAQTITAGVYTNLTLANSSKTADTAFSVTEALEIEAGAQLVVMFASTGSEWDGAKSTLNGSVYYAVGDQTIVVDDYAGGLKLSATFDSGLASYEPYASAGTVGKTFLRSS